MELDDEESWEHTNEAQSSFGCWMLVLTMCGVAVLTVVLYDVPYVDDFIDDIDVGEMADGISFDAMAEKFSVRALFQKFQSAESANNVAHAVDKAQDANEEEGPAEERAAPGRRAQQGQHAQQEEWEPPEYQGPISSYVEEGFDPDTVEFDFQAGGGAERDESLPRILSDRMIQRVVDNHQQELLDCYATELRRDPDLSGRVDFDFAVTPDGRVAMVRVLDSSLRSNAAEDCFVEKARNWRFPAIRHELPTRFETDVNFNY